MSTVLKIAYLIALFFDRCYLCVEDSSRVSWAKAISVSQQTKTVNPEQSYPDKATSEERPCIIPILENAAAPMPPSTAQHQELSCALQDGDGKQPSSSPSVHVAEEVKFSPPVDENSSPLPESHDNEDSNSTSMSATVDDHNLMSPNSSAPGRQFCLAWVLVCLIGWLVCMFDFNHCHLLLFDS